MLVLAACAGQPKAPPPPPPVVTPPPSLQRCPGPVRAPDAPPAPRTVAQLAKWGADLMVAYSRAETARESCAQRLARLNAWVAEHTQYRSH
jgi:hypothetical protein